MSREFDGASYYEWPGFTHAGNPCFAAWVQLGASGDYRGIIGEFGDTNLFDTTAAIFVDDTDKIRFHMSNGIGLEVAGSTSLSLDTWYLVGGQYDDVNMTVWINGVLDGLVAVGSTSLAAGAPNNRFVGYLSRFIFQPWIGLMENVAYWGRGLTEDEWASLYEGTSPSRINSWDPAGNPAMRSHWPLWGQYSDEPSIASNDTLVENGSLDSADPYEHVGSPWGVAG